ncbi:uncharacterized protein SPSK_04097 [Sporothrix schenckii 1099-18]|uniref:Saponin hydrolase n=1 Tax=Sporothrix schenckii 1099-18 TaxID=1397361 RepID=A0A0F2M498_SPOSC|nr:uncharacterized protein SPSK_04097 [Sporothrix schenckii 1099-18]KJR83635.1 hypothetical protein SPSK_04097 [Sporothrix schenckii 1099-18]
MFYFVKTNAMAIGLIAVSVSTVLASTSIPDPPSPEPVSITALPLPPVVSSNSTGACSKEINPNGTGCIANGVFNTFQSGDFLPDGKHVLAQVTFVGAPDAPDSASIYSGMHVILVKADDTTFHNGDPWKCVTCGVPAENAVGIDNAQYYYPQAFRDGSRLLIGKNVLDCGPHQVASEECTPNNTFIYPLYWGVTADGSGATGALREQRLHPDNTHIEFSAFTFSDGVLGELAYFARIRFNPSPNTGIPLAPRYDVVNVTGLYSTEEPAFMSVVDGNRLAINYSAITVGESRGFNGDGSEITYIGNSWESCNVDVFAVHLTTGAVRRLTDNPEYCDPVAFSPDNKWIAIMDTRGSGRQMFIAGMRGIPPLVDIVASVLPSSTRNNGVRRFFEPYLLDFYGDRGAYNGQRIIQDRVYGFKYVNDSNNGVPGSGSISDPEWNGMADPRWSLDSTRLVFWQTHTTSPNCGGTNPLPCYPSKEPGGRDYRLYVATFTSRKPSLPVPVSEHDDVIPWGTPYVPGSAVPKSDRLASGIYTLHGKASGYATVNLTWGNTTSQIGTVSVEYRNCSDDGHSYLNGHERVAASVANVYVFSFDWYSDFTQSGSVNATKKTGPSGYQATINVEANVLTSNGSLTTTVDGVEWTSPLSGT